ncbi:MAG: ATP-binding protein [Alphaproteobacteria bacterium]|nr:ATP-binding protein [Alphaproteobacteria bacterium]
MYRKIYEKLKRWKENSNGKSAVLIDGARRIGKSYIAELFAKNEYKSYIVIDFNAASDEIKDLFNYYLSDLDQFFFKLSVYTKTNLFERNSVIIFDEVQLFPRARAAIKYLVKDGRYDYIETGSLISIKKNVNDIVIPSEEYHLKMYPMDFFEFLIADGNELYIKAICQSFEKKEALGQALFRKINDEFLKYLVVGGMPQAVLEYINTRDFEKVDFVKRDILSLYEADISKYSGRDVEKVRAIFNQLPSQLQKNEKKFKLSSLSKKARLREYENAFFWLGDAMIVNIAYNATQPSIGLKLNLDNLTFKCYMGDTGLLISHSFDEKGIINNDVYTKIITNKLEFNKGMIIENIVSQMLVANDRRLYFYSSNARELIKDKMEIDFLIAKDKITARHNISPIEVKSGKNYTLSSLNKFKCHFSGNISTSYVLHPSDLKVENDVVYLPLFMTGLL